ncbi:hypothetical protein GCM10009754_20750 [Amycolatopsis minnesotensis]|uniref:Uncharacterized protein n=1 Tax=Amycolatopsis minnesotensis TaxID=337894 RepID=A0ABN2QG44_9PSEU
MSAGKHSTEGYAAGYDRLLTPLADAGVELILIEPFLRPIRDCVEVRDVHSPRRPSRSTGRAALDAGQSRFPVEQARDLAG